MASNLPFIMYPGLPLEREEWVGQQREEREESRVKAMTSPRLLPDVAATLVNIAGSKNSPEGRKKGDGRKKRDWTGEKYN